MRYREMPRLRFKKHTSRRKRRMVTKITMAMWMENAEAIAKAELDRLIYGTSFFKMSWEDK